MEQRSYVLYRAYGLPFSEKGGRQEAVVAVILVVGGILVRVELCNEILQVLYIGHTV